MIPVALALVCAGVQLALVATHPEPTGDDPDLVHKPSYRSLVDWRWTLALLAVCTALGLLITRSSTPLPAGWAVWAGCGLVWVWVDARTTWLPPRCTAVTWAALGVASLATPESRSHLPVMALGAIGAWAVFWLFWRLSGALGFGDVHLAAMVGALGASDGLTGWSTALLAGTALAAVWGVVVMVWRRRRPHPLGTVFAYGPGLWAGAWATLLV